MARSPAIAAVAATLLVIALGFSLHRVWSLERAELLHESPWRSLLVLSQNDDATRISARLTEVELTRGEEVTFEVCAQGSLSTLEDALDLVAWIPKTQSMELKVPLDRENLARVKGRGTRSCIKLGGGEVARAGRYALEAVWHGRSAPNERQLALPLRARVLAKPKLERRDAMLVLATALWTMLLTLSAFAPGPAHAPTLAPRASAAWALVFCGLQVLSFFAIMRLPLGGATGGLVRGLLVGASEALLAYSGARLWLKPARAGLALSAPARAPGAWLLAAAGCALLLRPISRLAMEWVPSTGEAPIETFVAWSSGALSFALLGVTVPIAEELFFRGLVYGGLLRLGRTLAVAGSLTLFTLAHAQQTWGNWGALLAILCTGASLTLLRALSGSTLVPAVAHILYNLSLWAGRL